MHRKEKRIRWKWSCILLSILCCFLMLSANVFAQEKKVSFSCKEMPLSEALTQVERQSDFKLNFNYDELNQFKVTVNIKKESIQNAITTLLKGLPYQMKVNGKFIIVFRRSIQRQQSRSIPRQGAGFTVIRGKVVDSSDNPLPGVNVSFKDRNYGATTDVNGMYGITVEKGGREIMLFSFIGMKTKVLSVSCNAEEKTLNVILEESSSQLGEVVVTGYQTIEKRKLTSAVTTLKMDDINVPALNTVDQMLEGHVPGMMYMQNSGQLGATPRLRIRGTSTILGSEEPLWVVDGIVQTDPVNVNTSNLNDMDFVNLLGNAISGLNPQDIEQIDVLKDASATAIYGAKAANGVIVITTKKGKEGTPSVNYSFICSYAARPRYLDRSVNMMNSKERIALSRDLIEKKIVFPSIDSWVGYEGALKSFYDGNMSYDEMINKVGAYEKLNTDWFDILCQDALSTKHSLSISGGSQNTNYYVSVGYNDLQGNIKGEKNKTYTTYMKLSTQYKRISAQFTLQANVAEKKYTPSDVNIMNYAYKTSRAMPAYNSDGSLWYYNRSANSGSDAYSFNIINERNNASQDINSNGITFTAAANVRIIEPLKFGVTIAYSVDNTNQDTYHGENSYYIAQLRNTSTLASNTCPYGGEMKNQNTRKNSYMIRSQLDYNQFFDKNRKHQIIATIGGELSSTKYIGTAQTSRCYLPERGESYSAVDLATYTMYALWTQTPEALGVRTHQLTNMFSGYASASYSYNDIYILNANARADYSNKFGNQANNKFLPIWSLSSRWNLSKKSLKNVKWINELSLRASYGWQGNMLDDETTRLIISRGGYNYKFGEYSSSIYKYANPNLKWEKTSSTNITTDFSLFNNKIRGTISYFYKKTRDAFLPKTVSSVNGVDTYVVNSGTITNRGLEVSLNFTPINNRKNDPQGFRWSFDPQIGQVINNLVSRVANSQNLLTDRNAIVYSDYLNGNVKIANKPLYSFYSYKFKGLNSTDGRPDFEGTDRATYEKAYAGMDKEKVFLSVMEYSGTRMPIVQGGLINTFAYKNFYLSFNLAYSFGAKVRLQYLYTDLTNGAIAPQPAANVRKEMINRWKNPGDEKYTNIPTMYLQARDFSETLSPWWNDNTTYSFADNIWQMYNNANIRVVSANYVKLQSVSFRYNLPDSFCKNIFLKSGYVGFSGTNLFTICSSKLKGQDPTTSGTSSAINMSVRPTFAINLNFSF